MKSDLIERYIYAVTRRLPGRTREDVGRELQTLIEDMLKERCGDLTPTGKDIRVVLTELGTPQELYVQYAGDEKKCLIGEPYYTTYKMVLKIVLACVTFGMTLGILLDFGMSGFITESGELMHPLAGILQAVGMLFNGVMVGFAFVTALFAFFYHKEIPLDNNTGLDDLPPVPVKKETISRTECIFGIGISVLFMTVFLICPQVLAAVVSGEKMIPVFNIAVVRSTWYIIVIFGILGISGEIVKLLDGKYTGRVVAVTVITDLLSALCSVWWLGRNDILNSEFVSFMGQLFEEESDFLVTIFAKFQYFFLAMLLFALLLDMGVTLYKGFCSRQSA